MKRIPAVLWGCFRASWLAGGSSRPLLSVPCFAPLTDRIKAGVAMSNDFYLRLFREILNERPGESVFLSLYSLAARGTTGRVSTPLSGEH